MLFQLSHIFSPLFPSALYPPPQSILTPLVHVHGSYIYVLWLFHFPYYSYRALVYFAPTIDAPYSLYPFPHSAPSPSPPITLLVISISVIHSCSTCLLSWILFLFFLGSVIDTFEFVVILLFIVLILFSFLDKSL